MTEPRFPFVHVDVEPELSDEVGGLLWELGAEGVEERDGTTLIRAAVEGKVTLVAAFSTREEADAAVAELDPGLNPRVEEVIGDKWRDAWKEFFKPFSLTPSVTVRPPWEEYTPSRDGEIVLELEPGRAFGTGLHPTTTLVARALERDRESIKSKHLLDLGTGSGILAFVAIALGAAKVDAYDIDEDVIGVVEENAARNAMADKIVAKAGVIDDVKGTYPIVLANIEARILIPIAEPIIERVAPGGRLILSGILDGQENDVLAAYGAMKKVAIDREGEWVAITLDR
ncbi:MAG: 50S ribosomal protein L11 methyltransferase [Polyangiaceae bacterium]